MVGSAAPISRRILITVDERAASERLFTFAIDQIYRPGDAFHILHIINPCKRPVGQSGEGIVGEDVESRCEVERRARQFLKERFEKRLKELQIPCRIEIARSCCDSDSIGALLCKRAEQLDAAMLLLSKEKRGALKQFFIGSVSNYCLHHSSIPVLVLQGSASS